MPWDAIASGLGTIASIVNTAQVNKTNMKMQRETNAANREMVQMQNDAAAAESQKAYDRSKATNQVNLMTSAGMSRAGAINSLNGGGSYTPAPVNTSQDSAPQMQTTDFSGLSNLAQIALQKKQLKQQERMQDKQLKAQAEESKKQREHDLLMQDIATLNQTQHDYIEYEKHKDRLNLDTAIFEYNKPKIDAEIGKIKSATELDQINLTSAQLDNIRKQLEIDNYPTLARLANEESMRRIQKCIIDYQIALENHNLDKQAKTLLNEFNSAVQQSNIDVTNARNDLETYMHELHLRKNSAAGGFFASLELFINNYMPNLLKLGK